MKKLSNDSGIYRTLKKILLKMKLTVTLMLFCFAGMSASTYSQNIRLDINYRGDNIIDLFYEIEQKSEFYFFYQKEDLAQLNNISVNVKDASVAEILDKVLVGTSLNYKIVDRYIIIRNKERMSGEDKIYTEQKMISGIVTDDSGQPLPGVTVIVKGTTQGTITVANGNYSLSNVSEDAILVFSFIGMKTQEIPVAGKTTINITLAEETIGVDEVVVIGYGTQKKSNLTSAVEMVDTKVLENRPVMTLGEMLVGEVPNLNVNISSGAPDATTDFNIRGYTGFGTSAQPLILVDGVEQDINLVNPDDVESISVLKDAAASAIYGSRAPYGVILIKTKSGKKGQKMQINYSGNMNIEKPNLMEPESSLNWVTNMNNKLYNSEMAPIYSDATIQGIIDNMNGTGPNNIRRSDGKWEAHGNATNGSEDVLGLVYKDFSVSHSHDLNIQGGSDKTTYYISIGYDKKQGIYQSDFDFSEKYSAISKVNTDLTDFLTVRSIIRYGRQDATRPNSGWRAPDDSFSSDKVLNGNSNFYFFPNVPNINPDGTYHWLSALPAIRGLAGVFNSENSNLMLSGGFDFKPITDLVIKGDLSYTENNIFSKRDTKHVQVDAGDGTLRSSGRTARYDEVKEIFSKTQGHTIDLHATYSKKINKHDFLLMAGFQQEDLRLNSLTGSNRYLYSTDIMSISTSYGESPFVDDDISHWSTRGYFFRGSYNYNGKYLLDINSRYDAASKYAPESRWAFFPSVSAGYNIAKEKFWKIDEISRFKITASWGKLGDQAAGNYLYISNLETNLKTPYILNNAQVPYVSQGGLVSSSLTWAKPRVIGAGLEVGAFNNRLQTEYRWYQRTVFDQAGPADTYPEVLGTDPPQTNNAITETRGWELSLAWRDKGFNLMNSPLNYSVRVVVSDYIGYVVEYEDNISGKISGEYTPGQEFGVLYGYKGLEVIRDEQRLLTDMLWKDDWNYTGSTYIPDVNGDGRINGGDGGYWYSRGDEQKLGYTYPRYKYSIRLGASWKAFDLSVFLDGVGKQVYYSSQSPFLSHASRSSYLNIALEEHNDLGFYSENNKDAFYPRIFQLSSPSALVSDTYKMNLAHLRVKNVNLSYSVPKNVAAKLKLSYIRFNISGENLGFIYNKLRISMDPIQVMQDGSTYPILQVYSLGVKIGL